MPANLLRLAYVFEFLLAILAIFELWSQVGGQGHLDLMPWYTKLGLAGGLALTTVMGTASAVRHERAWNPKTMVCVLLALLLAGGMACASYYYHLHENDDAGSDEGDGVAVARLPAPLWAGPSTTVRRGSVRESHKGAAAPGAPERHL